MSQPKGFAQPIDALLAVATALGGFTIADQQGQPMEPDVFVGDYEVGGVIDCCPNGVLRIESTGELPTQGVPMTVGKHGCFELTMGVRVTFLTCYRTISKSGTVITDPSQLDYTRIIQRSRWDAIRQLRLADDFRTRHAVRFSSSQPIGTDGKCSGWQIDLQASLDLCQDFNEQVTLAAPLREEDGAQLLTETGAPLAAD